MNGPSEGSVDIWLVDLDAPDAAPARDRAGLDAEERIRADRFVRDLHGRRWARGRSALRHILSSYTGQEPAALTFHTGPEGKPRLRNSDGIEFNVSHSGSLFGLAVSASEVGLDVELAEPRRRLHDVVTKVFSGPSLERFRSLEPRQRLPVFYRGWTMKEAVLKCLGRGVFALGHIELVLGEDLEPVLAGVTLPEWDPVRAGVEALSLGQPGSWGPTSVVGSLATLEAPAGVRVRTWSPSGRGPD